MKAELEEKVVKGREVGGYRIDRKLGAGGYGGVYLAWRDGRAYALKFLHLESVGEWGWRELFVMLPHSFPHVVRLRSHFQWPEDAPEYLVLVMEYVPGTTLYAWARDHNPCAREVVEKLLPLSQALMELHAREVLHRDLKGDNVLVRETDGATVLVDLGAGSIPHAPRATLGALPPASLLYRSPESLAFSRRQGFAPGARYAYAVTDELYALGVMLYVLTTDAYPFEGPGEMLANAILEGQPMPPHVRNSRVPEPLSRLCLRLLALEPGERVPGADVLYEELEALLHEFRGDRRWELPLCHGWTEEGRTTEDVVLEGGKRNPEAELAKWARRKPKRGKRPTVAVASPGHRSSRALPVLVSLGLGALVGWVLWGGWGDDLDSPSNRLKAWMTQSAKDAAIARPGEPPRLVPNQKRAPCTVGLEREVSGGCWIPVERTTPNCPVQTVAYEGRCLLPVAKSPSVPMSVDAGGSSPASESSP